MRFFEKNSKEFKRKTRKIGSHVQVFFTQLTPIVMGTREPDASSAPGAMRESRCRKVGRDLPLAFRVVAGRAGLGSRDVSIGRGAFGEAELRAAQWVFAGAGNLSAR